MVITEERGEERRYFLLETLRDYGRLCLSQRGETDAMLRRHFDYFLQRAEDLMRMIAGPEQNEYLPKMDDEMENFRAALEWSLAHEPGDAVRLAATLAGYWLVRDLYTEGRRWLDLALERGDGADLMWRIKALRWSFVMAYNAGRVSEAQPKLLAALELCRDVQEPEVTAAILSTLGSLYTTQGDLEEGKRCYMESLRLRRSVQEYWGVSDVLKKLGELCMEMGDLEAATSYLTESLPLIEQHGTPLSLAETYTLLANVALLEGDDEAVRDYLKQSEAQMAAPQSSHLLAGIRRIYGDMAYGQGAWQKAQEEYVQSLKWLEEIAARVDEVFVTERIARLAARTGHAERAARLMGAAQRFRADHQLPSSGSHRSLYKETVKLLASQLEPEALEHLQQEGAAFKWLQILSLALDPLPLP
jgi:tetratricopeptide (TPR) repeat protein